MTGRIGSTVGLVDNVVARKMSCLAIGPCGHSHCTVTAISTAAGGQLTNVSIQRASSEKRLALAECNGRPSLCVLLVDNQLIPACDTGRRSSTCGTPVGWQVSPEGTIILGSLAALWGQVCQGEEKIKRTSVRSYDEDVNKGSA